MAKSQNGWPVATKAQQDQGPFAGVRFPNGILAGDVAAIARWQLARYEATVEQLIDGSCWGWYVKEIEGSETISNHASGTAWDINASKYPMGKPASAVMSSAKIAACREIIRAAGGVLRWGGDYTGRPDPMHWEIDCTPSEAHAFAVAVQRKVTYMDLEVRIPQLRQGDNDNVRDGYDIIRRMQRIVGAEPDGIWGPATTAKVADYCDVPTGDADSLTEGVWRKVFGGARVPA